MLELNWPRDDVRAKQFGLIEGVVFLKTEEFSKGVEC